MRRQHGADTQERKRSTMKVRCYSEMKELRTIQERYEYLKLGGEVGSKTFGFDRYLNQVFYRSREWRRVRDIVTCRDEGWDLGVLGYPCGWNAAIHHMNPVRREQLLNGDPDLLNPEYLVLVSFDTHEKIHYGDLGLQTLEPIVRAPNDQVPWR